MNTMTQTSCSWSTHLTIWTFVISIIILAALGTIIFREQPNWVFLVVLFVLASPILLSPRKVQVTDDAVMVKMVAFSYSIPVKDIEKIEPYKSSPGLRMCGIGAFFGNVGWFKNETLGKHLKFVTDSSKSYTIYRKNDIPVVVTANDGTIFSQFTPQN